MEQLKNIKQLNESINNEIKTHILNRRKYAQHKNGNLWGYDFIALMPLNGYQLKEVENKPAKMLEAKEKYKNSFVAFVVCFCYNNGQDAFITFNLSDEKKERDAIDTGLTNWGKGARDYARKGNYKTYILLNKEINLYFEAVKRHNTRKQNKVFSLLDRFGYNDKDFDEFTRKAYATIYGFSHNSLNDHRWDNLSNCTVDIGGFRYDLKKCQTRQEVYSNIMDKNGYFKLYYKDALRVRVEQLKREKARAKAEQERKTWEQADKSETQKAIYNLLDESKKEFETLGRIMILKNMFDFYALDRLEDWGELAKKLTNALKDINGTFKSFEEVNGYIKEKKNHIKLLKVLTSLTLQDEETRRRAYGFSWWEFSNDNEIINTYNSKEYYKRIVCSGGVWVGVEDDAAR